MPPVAKAARRARREEREAGGADEPAAPGTEREAGPSDDVGSGSEAPLAGPGRSAPGPGLRALALVLAALLVGVALLLRLPSGAGPEPSGSATPGPSAGPLPRGQWLDELPSIARAPLVDLGTPACGPNFTLFYAPSSTASQTARAALEGMGGRVALAEECVGLSPSDVEECTTLSGAEGFARASAAALALNVTRAPAELVGCRFLRQGTLAHISRRAEDAELATLACALSDPMPEWCWLDVRYERPAQCAACGGLDDLAAAVSNPRARVVRGPAPPLKGQAPPYLLVPKELYYYDARLERAVERIVQGDSGRATFVELDDAMLFLPPVELVATLVGSPCPICNGSALEGVVADVRALGGRVEEGAKDGERTVAPAVYIDARAVRSHYPEVQALVAGHRGTLRALHLDESDPNTPLVLAPAVYERADNSCGNSSDAYLFFFYSPGSNRSEGAAYAVRLVHGMFGDAVHIMTECVSVKEGDDAICSQNGTDLKGYEDAKRLRAIFGLREVPAYVYDCRYVRPDSILGDELDPQLIVLESDRLRRDLCALLGHAPKACRGGRGEVTLPLGLGVGKG